MTQIKEENKKQTTEENNLINVSLRLNSSDAENFRELCKNSNDSQGAIFAKMLNSYKNNLNYFQNNNNNDNEIKLLIKDVNRKANTLKFKGKLIVNNQFRPFIINSYNWINDNLMKQYYECEKFDFNSEIYQTCFQFFIYELENNENNENNKKEYLIYESFFATNIPQNLTILNIKRAWKFKDLNDFYDKTKKFPYLTSNEMDLIEFQLADEISIENL